MGCGLDACRIQQSDIWSYKWWSSFIDRVRTAQHFGGCLEYCSDSSIIYPSILHNVWKTAPSSSVADMLESLELLRHTLARWFGLLHDRQVFPYAGQSFFLIWSGGLLPCPFHHSTCILPDGLCYDWCPVSIGGLLLKFFFCYFCTCCGWLRHFVLVLAQLQSACQPP